MSKISWKISGDMVLSCNCDVFCPCVASLGKARPTYGYCQAWGALKINTGFAGDETLDGLNLAFMLDIPGRMSEGNWTSAIYVDERANEMVAKHLTAIMKGELGGPADGSPDSRRKRYRRKEGTDLHQPGWQKLERRNSKNN